MSTGIDWAGCPPVVTNTVKSFFFGEALQGGTNQLSKVAIGDRSLCDQYLALRLIKIMPPVRKRVGPGWQRQPAYVVHWRRHRRIAHKLEALNARMEYRSGKVDILSSSGHGSRLQSSP